MMPTYIVSNLPKGLYWQSLIKLGNLARKWSFQRTNCNIIFQHVYLHKSNMAANK